MGARGGSWTLLASAGSRQADESIAAPKGRGSRSPRTFLCITACSRTAGRGHHRPVGPLASRRRDGGRRPCLRCGSTSRVCKKAHRADERIFAPKGVRPSHPEQDFIRFAGIFGFGRGTVMGAKGGDYRPHPYLSAKSHPPLWQYFSRLRRADERIFAPKGHRSPHPLVFGLIMRFAASRRGPVGAVLARESQKGVPPSAGCQASTRPLRLGCRGRPNCGMFSA
jgi:hypothetical protein